MFGIHSSPENIFLFHIFLFLSHSIIHERVIVVRMIFKLSFGLRFQIYKSTIKSYYATNTNTLSHSAFRKREEPTKNKVKREEKYVLRSTVFYPKLLSRYTLILHTHMCMESEGEREIGRESDVDRQIPRKREI